MIMALLLDLANIVGGFLLAVALLRRLPRVGDDLGRAAARMAAFGWVVGIVALVAGGYYVLVHLFSGPRVFHFEVVGIGVGVALLWDRLTGRRTPTRPGPAAGGTVSGGGTASVGAASGGGDRGGDRTDDHGGATGRALLLAIFGLIAIVVGFQGLFTPDG